MVPAGIAGAQIESRCLTPEMPKTLLPTWVTQLPKVESQEVSAPLASEKADSQNASANAVKDLASMPKEVRAAIELAQSGKYREAAMGGDALLRLPSHQYGDFTWDYLANATAWSHIQTGSLKGAENAHSAAVTRVADAAVCQYHRLAAAMLAETEKSANQLKDYATYREEVTKRLATRLEDYKRKINAGKQNPSSTVRERCLNDAYDHLRVMVAADPDTANERYRPSFREAADGLVKVVAPALLAEARRARDSLADTGAKLLPERQSRTWNSKVKTLWNKVQRVKRICRMHDYLVRAKLANSGDADRIFREAHRLLFAPDDPGLVWQQLGHTITLNGAAHKDLRCKVPYQETEIAPIGMTASRRQARPTIGNKTVKRTGKWRKIDGKMEGKMLKGQFGKMEDKMLKGQFGKMDGTMQKGQFGTMEGKMQKGQFGKMEGKMQKGQFGKMEGTMEPMRE